MDSKIDQSSSAPQAALTAVRLEQAGHMEWYLTGKPAAALPAREAVQEVYGQVAAHLAQNRVEVLQEKIYGLRRKRGEILALRADALRGRGLDADRPFTFLEGTPADGAAFAGVQIWGVASSGGERLVQTIEADGVRAGRRWDGPGFCVVVLASLDGRGPDGSLPDCPTCQTRNMFSHAGAGLAAQGLAYTDVARTWIFLARILDWYGEFNRVRTAKYTEMGLAPGGAVFPASTGIQAQSDQEECLMDLLAVQVHEAGSVRVRPVARSARQDSAFSYGSAFSRATVIERGGRKTVHISGTASIAGDGRSTHLGDPEAQCLDTLLSVAALLEEQGGGLEDICQATAFCKTPAVFEAYRGVGTRLRLPRIPTVHVIADVCRPELLFELEAVAII